MGWIREIIGNRWSPSPHPFCPAAVAARMSSHFPPLLGGCATGGPATAANPCGGVWVRMLLPGTSHKSQVRFQGTSGKGSLQRVRGPHLLSHPLFKKAGGQAGGEVPCQGGRLCGFLSQPGPWHWPGDSGHCSDCWSWLPRLYDQAVGLHQPFPSWALQKSILVFYYMRTQGINVHDALLKDGLGKETPWEKDSRLMGSGIHLFPSLRLKPR